MPHKNDMLNCRSNNKKKVPAVFQEKSLAEPAADKISCRVSEYRTERCNPYHIAKFKHSPRCQQSGYDYHGLTGNEKTKKCRCLKKSQQKKDIIAPVIEVRQDYV